MEPVTLQGHQIRLDPLELRHADALAAAAANDRDLYRWSPVPQSREEALQYIKTALAWQRAGTAISFVIVRATDETVIGSTRFWNLERWPWPEGHPSHGRATPDVCEIGYTWLASSAIRTGANTEAKLLMLRYAFEVWQVLRVCLHTDVRNQRSRAAIERIGGRFEGILRAHRIAADFIPRDSARYSIIADEWPELKQGLMQRIEQRRGRE
jgi:RimJ/RimL family protein N-acetyltransferase